MPKLYGMWYGQRDIQLFEVLNKEILDHMLQIVVTIYKVCPEQNEVNIYGETSGKTGKMFYPGIAITCNMKKEEISAVATDFGPDKKQIIKFEFLESKLKAINLFPQEGDIIEFNERLHEIDRVAQEQFLGGVAEKSLSIICDSHYSRLSKSDLFIRT